MSNKLSMNDASLLALAVTYNKCPNLKKNFSSTGKEVYTALLAQIRNKRVAKNLEVRSCVNEIIKWSSNAQS